MSTIATRLKSAQPNARAANTGGCVTCRWWQDIDDETRRLVNEWIDNRHSIKQLYDILSTPTDDDTEPTLTISVTGFRLHMNHHDVKCRRG